MRALLLFKSDPAARAASRFWIAAVAIVALAAAMRFWELSEAPIWMDEAFTILAAKLPVEALLFERVDVHPPLFYLLQKAWASINDSLALARVPAAVFGVLVVVAAMGMMCDLVSRETALWTGLILALGTGQIYYSQDARMYSLLVVLLALSAWGLIGLLVKPPSRRRRYLWLYVLGAAGAIYTQMIALAFLFALNLAAVASLPLASPPEGRPRWPKLLQGNLLLLVLALPWLIQLGWALSHFGRDR